MHAFSEFIAEQQLNLVSISRSIIELPFSLDRGVERNPAPIGERVAQFQRVAVVMPTARALVFLEILIVIFKIHLEPVGQAELDFLLKQMLRLALAGKGGVQTDFGLDLPRWLDIDVCSSD